MPGCIACSSSNQCHTCTDGYTRDSVTTLCSPVSGGGATPVCPAGQYYDTKQSACVACDSSLNMFIDPKTNICTSCSLSGCITCASLSQCSVCD
jgi:hypothetical protein